MPFPEYCLLQKPNSNIPSHCPKLVFDIYKAPELALLADVVLYLVVDCHDVGDEAAAVRGAVVLFDLFDLHQSCQMAKYDPFLSLDCARVDGVGAQSKERKG